MSEGVFDVAVVGAGTSGVAVARAFALKGRSVLLLDRRDGGAGGARWVDSIPSWCFEAARVAAPRDAELYTTDHGAAIVRPPGRGAAIRIAETPMLHVEIPALVARLAREAGALGVRSARGTVAAVETLGDRARIDIEGGGRFEARLVVDASGLGGAVRSRFRPLAERCEAPRPEDVCTAAQWRYEVRDRAAAVAFLAKHGAAPGDTLAFPSLAGGYSTLTFFTSRALDHIGVLTGSIPALGAPNGAALLDRFVARAPFLGARLHGGQGAIPLRRPYATLARDRVALIGDAACQVYSSHGSGVGMGLVAGRMLADACGATGDPGDPARLARYERDFHRRYGPLLAAADAFRRFSQALPFDDVVTMFDAGLLDASLAGQALSQRPIALGPADALRSLRRALSAPRLAARFAVPVARTLALQALLGALPPPAAPALRNFWDRSVNRLVGPSPERLPRLELIDVEA